MKENCFPSNRQAPLITIVTPTYNRRSHLTRLYASLCSQTHKNFIWYVIDDGSTDGTGEYIDHISRNSPFEIKYFYKSNGGKHSALNLAFKTVTTELLFIVDSDDYIVDDAIETIYADFKMIQSDQYCGIVYKKGKKENNPIGGYFKDECYRNYNQVRYFDKIKGDHAEVWKTKCLKQFEFPEFDGEVFVAETYVWVQMCEIYDVYLRNKVIYICEYLKDGLSLAGRKFRIKNPKGGMANSLMLTSPGFPLAIRIKNTLLYISYGLFAREKISRIVKMSKSPFLTFILCLPGYVLYQCWKWKYRV